MSSQDGGPQDQTLEVLTLLEHWHKPEFACGWGAAFVNICVTFPLNKVIFRQQLHGVRSLIAITQLRREGIRHIYRGLLPPLLQKTTSMSLMFGMYYECQRQLHYYCPTLSPSVVKPTAAMLAGSIEALLTPFERVQVLLQDGNYHNHYNNTAHAFSELRQHYGLREFYRGTSAVLLRNGPSNVLFFSGREYIVHKFANVESTSGRILLDFLSGAMLGAFISTLCYPLNVIKVRMQCEVGGEFKKMLPTFRLVLAERDYSFKKLFRGVHTNYTRSFVSWGIINVTYELLMKNVFKKQEADEF